MDKSIPLCLSSNLNPIFKIREYQTEAYARFLDYYKNPYSQPIHLLYNMATGSGKTIIMAWLILYLYEQLMMSCRRNRYDVVHYLLSLWADPRLKDSDGYDAFLYAEPSDGFPWEMKNKQRISDLLLEYVNK